MPARSPASITPAKPPSTCAAALHSKIAAPTRNSRNSTASVQTTAAMPPIQVHSTATTLIAPTAVHSGGEPVSASKRASSGASSTSSKSAVM